MIFVDADTVEQMLSMDRCIDLMRQTLMEYSMGGVVQVLRTAMTIGEGKILGVMPSAINSRRAAGAKIITVFPGNFHRGLPSHQGVVVLFETEYGRIRAVVDGEAITGIRTAAMSAAATDALARKDARILCVMGSGLQARRHLEAMRLVRDIEEVRVWDVSRDSAARYAEEMSLHHGIPVYDCSGDAERAVSGADIICTVTAAKEPILFGKYVAPGAHINAVGACAAGDREIDSDLAAQARFFGDSRESVMGEAGDFLIPLAEGRFAESHFLGEIGQVLTGNLTGRANEGDITVFEALGLAVEDLAAADYVVDIAESLALREDRLSANV